MIKTILFLIVFQLSIFTLQAQTTTEEKEQLKKVNQELVANYKAGKLDDALSSAQKAVDLSNKIYGAESLETAIAYKNLGIIYRTKKNRESVLNLQKALDIYRLKPEQNVKLVAQTLNELALTFAFNGDGQKAEEIYTEAIAIAEKAYGKESKEIIPFLKSMTEVYILVKKYEEAQTMFVRQYLTTKKYFQAGSDELQAIKDTFDCFTYRSFRIDQAIEKQKAFDEAIRGEKDIGFSGGGTIGGGIVNGKAKNLVKPAYPSNARAKLAQGTVSVRVTIDEEGMVIEAKAFCGDVELRAASEEAARQSKFSKIMLGGQPVKVTGTIVYNFIP